MLRNFTQRIGSLRAVFPLISGIRQVLISYTAFSESEIRSTVHVSTEFQELNKKENCNETYLDESRTDAGAACGERGIHGGGR